MQKQGSPADHGVWNRTRALGILVGISVMAASAARAQVPCNLIAMAGGAGHTLALTAEGDVLAWGSNAYGELGTGGRSFAVESPVPVFGISAIVAIAAGDHFSLALRNDGRVFAWGENSFGALGNGSTKDVPTVMMVPGLTSVTAIAAGSHHAVALRSDGSVWAWGGTWAGQFASTSLVYQPTPAPTLLTGMTQIAAGGTSTLALDDSGSVFAMGTLTGGNNVGPMLVPDLDSILAIAAGGNRSGKDHGLALRGDGTVLAWGNNSFGQLGDNSTTDRITPVPVFNLGFVTAIAAGGHHSLAVSSGVTLTAWGRNDFGQLGDGTFTHAPSPVAVNTSAAIANISAGMNHTLATFADGEPRTWGWSGSGQLGRLAGSHSTTPVAVPVGSLGTVVSASTRGESTAWIGNNPLDGHDHTLTLDQNGQVWAFGSNRHGQLGTGDTVDARAPIAVPGVDNVIDVAAGARHSLALQDDGTVWAWGNNSQGQLGDGTTLNSLAPVAVAGLMDVTAIAAGERDSLAITSDGSVWSWGWFSGPTPAAIPGLAGTFTAVAAGAKFYLALRDDGTVWSWGWNDFGQLGNGSTEPFVDTAGPVYGLTGITAISAGGSHALALAQNGDVLAWGSNQHGQLGNGSITMSRLPQQVTAFSGARAVAAGSDHSLVALSTGGVLAFGRNFVGEAGGAATGDGARALLPVAVNGAQAVAHLSAGSTTSLAWNLEGNLEGWGWNGVGQLGNNTVNRSSDVGMPALDARPAPQGNILFVVRRGGDVLLDYSAGTAQVWTVYRDSSKDTLGNNVLVSPLLAKTTYDDGALSRPSGDFYSVRGLSACSFTPEG